MKVRIVTHQGEREVEAERVDGIWALHRSVIGEDCWSVTWLPSGHAIGGAHPMGREIAESVFDMVTSKWPHWPRRHEGQRLTASLKRRTLEALRDDVGAIAGWIAVGVQW